jgi:chemotaxis protein methyltransferase CheR
MFGFFKKKEVPQESVVPVAQSRKDYNNPDRVIAYFKAQTGITFEKQRDIFRKKLETFCIINHIDTFDECLNRVQEEASLRQELTNALTTNESYFFREYAQFEQMVAIAKTLPRPFRILCAPCATGEEPYSITIVLLEAGFLPSSFEVIGVDINTKALEHARKGRYNERSMRNIPEALRQKYFSSTDGAYYEVNQSLRAQVSLHQVNIFETEFLTLGKFDLVFSRNMLIYFDKETKRDAQKILESVRRDPEIPVFFGHADLF